jgi:hypothetical protein
MNNQINKIGWIKATSSLLIGAIGILSLFLSWNVILETFVGKILRNFLSLFYEKNFRGLIFIDCFLGFCSTSSYLIVSPVFALGIFLGVKSLKSSQRKIAILGIILCTIDLIGSLFTTYVWWWFLAR